MSWDDPPEPDEDDEETFGKPKTWGPGTESMRIDVVVKTASHDGKTVVEATAATSQFHDHVVESALRHEVKRVVSEAGADSVRKMMNEAIQAVIEIEARPLVLKLLTEGWSEFNTYGGEKGKKTVAAAVAALFAQREGSYNRPTPTWFETLVREIVDASLKNEIRPIITTAAAEFKAKVDELLDTSIRDRLREAFGFKG